MQDFAHDLAQLGLDKEAQGKTTFYFSKKTWDENYGEHGHYANWIWNKANLQTGQEKKTTPELVNEIFGKEHPELEIVFISLDDLHFAIRTKPDVAMTKVARECAKHIIDAKGKQYTKVSITRDILEKLFIGHKLTWLMSDKATFRGKEFESLHIPGMVNTLLKKHKLTATVSTINNDELIFDISGADAQPNEQPELKKSWGDLPTNAFPALPGAKAVTKKPIKAILTKPMAKPAQVAPMTNADAIREAKRKVAQATLALAQLELEEAEAKAKSIN